MIEIFNYFNNDKENILAYIDDEKHIFPKMFIKNINLLHDSDFYEKLFENENLGYLFSLKNIKIFSIERIKETYAFKSDIDYKIICLFISNKHTIYLNDKPIKKNDYLIYNSTDEIFIKNCDFIKISFLETNDFSFDILAIPYKEKNGFSQLKIRKYSLISNDFFKLF